MRRVDNIHTRPLEEKGFHVGEGWDETIIEQLVRASRERHILSATPKDAAVRFYDETTATDWHEKRQKVVYGLFKSAELAGVVWYSLDPKPEAAADYTMAIRLYDQARGQHLSRPFLAATEQDFIQHHNPAAAWLETDANNEPAVALYKKQGYATHSTDGSRVVMRKELQ